MGTRIALCIMAKAPEAGRVKTRLCPPLSPDDAAELYRCFLLDKIAQARGWRARSACSAYAPAQAAAVFEALAPGFTLLAQRGDDLTARLVAVCDDLFRSGFDAAIMIDSDTPTLPTERLERAVALMSGGASDLVLPYLSERQWGTVREDYSAGRRRLGLLPARPRALARLPLGRGRARRHLRRHQRLCFALALWNGRDPILKERLFGPDRAGGQPRRGRQGVLLLPRLHADALVHAVALQVPAGGVPVRAAGRGEPPPRSRPARVRADRHRRLRRATATSTSTSSTRRPPSTTSSSGSR